MRPTDTEGRRPLGMEGLSGAEREWLLQEAGHLLVFGSRSRVPSGGFAWLGDDGTAMSDHPVELWVTSRMTHAFALGEMWGLPPGEGECHKLVEHGLAALAGPLRDEVHGGWFPALPPDERQAAHKETYGQAFVVLAAASALQAGHRAAGGLLAEALAVFDERLWLEDDGMVVDVVDRSMHRPDPYRGLNANMHTVEAFLAAADATGEMEWAQRARRICSRVADDLGPGWRWRLPEHFTPEWEPLPDYNREKPADPFRPYGATMGHGFEWARLLLAASWGPDVSEAARDSFKVAAVALHRQAVRDGWAPDGSDGFIYTTDWHGRPVVRHRMHWVAAEATASAAVLAEALGDNGHLVEFRRWWQHIRDHVIEAPGAWRHELDADLRPSATVWDGKPDVYHAVQACLIPLVEPSMSVAGSVRRAARTGSLRMGT